MKNKGMSREMYNFIIKNIDKLKYDLPNGKIITPKKTNGTVCSSTGYLRVKVDGKCLQVHQILAVIYFGDLCVGMTVNHINGNKLNNNKDNLELLTREDNAKHAHDNGLCNYAKGESINNSKLKESDVLEVIKKRSEGETLMNIADYFSVSKKTIENIIYGKTWKHITGF